MSNRSKYSRTGISKEVELQSKFRVSVPWFVKDEECTNGHRYFSSEDECPTCHEAYEPDSIYKEEL